MNRANLRKILLAGALLMFLMTNFRAAGQANGIYADFTTSMGSYTCRLEYALAPKAVANFIGLATGQRAWLDLPTGRARTNAFYNGLTFHRVVAGFVIQAGSPNGQGTDGPGFVVPDEITPSLRFTNTGILAMANSGTNSNGSQFFITATNTSFLNDGYTIFGELAGGTNVVLAINQVSTDANSKPFTNVVIQSVSIRRVGAAAQAFDIQAQGLPLVTNLPLRISNAGTQVSLAFSNAPFADNRLYSTTNMANWSSSSLGIETSVAPPGSASAVKDAPARFFSLAQVRYPSSTLAPKSITNHTVILNFAVGPGIMTNNFNASGGGTYTGSAVPPGTIVSYAWTQEPYRGNLFPIQFSGIIPMTLTLNFSGSSSGNFKGTAYPAVGTTPVNGTFTFN